MPPGFPGLPGPTGAPLPVQPDPQNQNFNQGNFNPVGGIQPTQPANAFVPSVPGTTSNPAIDTINNLLRTPRQPPNQPAANNQIGAGGLAGVASTYSGPSIKIYKEREKYDEWEFIFDLKQGLPGQAVAPQRPGQTNPGQTNPGQNKPGQNNPGQTGPGQTGPGPTSPGQPGPTPFNPFQLPR